MPAPRPNLRKLCPHGVYEKNARVWLRKPAGWSHEACVAQAEQEGRL